MIRITANLRPPNGKERTIGLLDIANRDGTCVVCDYDYRFGTVAENGDEAWQAWHVVRGHRRSDLLWALVEQTLTRHAAGDEEWSSWNETGQSRS